MTDVALTAGWTTSGVLINYPTTNCLIDTAVMTKLHVPGLHKVKNKKTGREYLYHRATATRLHETPGTDAFFEELKAARANEKKAAVQRGTLGYLIRDFKKTPDWSTLAEATRKSYQRAFDELADFDEVGLHRLSRAFVLKLRDEKIYPKRGRWLANYVTTVLSVLCEHAVNRDWIDVNPLKRTKKIRKRKGDRRVNRPWPKDEFAAVFRAAPVQLRVPLALIAYAGYAKGDALTVPWSVAKDGKMAHRRRKTDVATLTIPQHPDLKAILGEAQAMHQAAREHAAKKGRTLPPTTTIAITLRGRPWTVSGFDSSYAKLMRDLEEKGIVSKGLTPHGLRHNFGTRAREAGADLDLVRRLLGQKTLAMAAHYSEDADLSNEAEEVVDRLDMTGSKRHAPS